MRDNTGFLTLEISESSTIPKYKQIAQSIVRRIQTGHIRYGQKLPSINELSTLYLLSRDTVEKAYAELKEKNVIKSARGIGYFVSDAQPESHLKILVLFNKLSAHKKEIYNQFAHVLQDKAIIDFFIYHCDLNLFRQILSEHQEGYHYYVIMPHFKDDDPVEIKQAIEVIPPEKLIMLDMKISSVHDYFGAVYQDFKEDIFQALEKASECIMKYKKVILVFPDNYTYPYPKEIVQGFTKFCMFRHLNYAILNTISGDYKPEKDTAYVLISDNDLANLIKLSRNSGLNLGTDIGIISYNETVLKEVLEKGITVMSTDFKKMGELTANMILERRPIDHKNDFNLIIRNSL